MREYRDNDRGFNDDRGRRQDRFNYRENDGGGRYGASSDRRARSRSRSRERDRGGERERRDVDSRNHSDDRWRRRDRDQQYDGNRGYGGGDFDSRSGSLSEQRVPGTTVMIKGLPAHTTEPALYAVLAPYSPQNIRLIAQRDTGECKGFAFVEFYSVEYSQYFMTAFAGSAGDMNAPQLIVENRAVTLEYARDSTHPSQVSGSSEGLGHRGDQQIKSDWLCDTCGCQNFARRMQCYRCSAPKTESAVAVTANLTSDPFADVAIVTTIPSTTLAVRGLPLFATEEQVMETFRQFAPVRSVFLVRDSTSGMSRGIAFVEFHSVEYAAHALSNSSQLQMDRNKLKINFAKESIVANIPSFQQQQMMMMQYAGAASGGVSTEGHALTAMPPLPAPSAASSNHAAYAAAALQAAQWSATSYTQQQATTASAPLFIPQPTVASAPANPPRAKSSWPLNFETNGASYVFQAQSGVFYDASQRYYYCPKSRLYYNEVSGVYLCAAPVGSDHPYQEFEPPEPMERCDESACKSTGEASAAASGGTSSISQGRKPVKLAISLGGKSKSRAAEKKTETSEAVANVFSKKVSADIAKWGERKEELKDGEEEEGGGADSSGAPGKERVKKKSADVHIINLPAAPPPSVTKESSVSYASGTKCLLCRRQFTSTEQLQRHERESKLHAENAAKAAKAKASAPPSSDQTYRDRASERRAIYGQSAVPDDVGMVRGGGGRRRQRSNSAELPVNMSSSASVPSTAHGAVTENIPVAVFEDSSNPGNQLLRRMGWNDGKGLGKDESGMTESIAVTDEGGRASTSRVGVGNSKAAEIPSLEYGDDVAYKNSLMRVTRARFDQA